MNGNKVLMLFFEWIMISTPRRWRRLNRMKQTQLMKTWLFEKEQTIPETIHRKKFTFAHIGPSLDDPNSLFHHFHSCFEQFVGYTFRKAELEAYKKGGQFIPVKQPQLLKDILGAVLWLYIAKINLRKISGMQYGSKSSKNMVYIIYMVGRHQAVFEEILERSKKFWHSIIFFTFESALVNAWVLYTQL